MRIVIELKRDAIAGVVLNNLYSTTPLQETFGVVMLAIDDERPPQVSNLLRGAASASSPPPRRGHAAAPLRAAQGARRGPTSWRADVIALDTSTRSSPSSARAKDADGALQPACIGPASGMYAGSRPGADPRDAAAAPHRPAARGAVRGADRAGARHRRAAATSSPTSPACSTSSRRS